MTAPRHSRQEKLLFSGREDDFPTFLEQFEGVYALGLSDCLRDRIKTTPQKDAETNDERVKREGEEADRAKLHYMVSCELVQCLDKASIDFIRGQKPNGTAAWIALTSAVRKSQGIHSCFELLQKSGEIILSSTKQQLLLSRVSRCRHRDLRW